MRTLRLSFLLLATFAPASVDAQHASRQALLEPPRPNESVSCRPIAPPNRTLPASVLSYEWTYRAVRLTAAADTALLEPHQRLTAVWDSAGRLVLFGAAHDPTDSDSLQAGFALIASTSEPFVGRWIVVDGTRRTQPMSPEEIQSAQRLAVHFWSLRCPGSPTSQRAP
jgi:hypothetical protein